MLNTKAGIASVYVGVRDDGTCIGVALDDQLEINGLSATLARTMSDFYNGVFPGLPPDTITQLKCSQLTWNSGATFKNYIDVTEPMTVHCALQYFNGKVLVKRNPQNGWRMFSVEDSVQLPNQMPPHMDHRIPELTKAYEAFKNREWLPVIEQPELDDESVLKFQVFSLHVKLDPNFPRAFFRDQPSPYYKDTVKPVLIPCFDTQLMTLAPFVAWLRLQSSLLWYPETMAFCTSSFHTTFVIAKEETEAAIRAVAYYCNHPGWTPKIRSTDQDPLSQIKRFPAHPLMFILVLTDSNFESFKHIYSHAAIESKLAQLLVLVPSSNLIPTNPPASELEEKLVKVSNFFPITDVRFLDPVPELEAPSVSESYLESVPPRLPTLDPRTEHETIRAYHLRLNPNEINWQIIKSQGVIITHAIETMIRQISSTMDATRAGVPSSFCIAKHFAGSGASTALRVICNKFHPVGHCLLLKRLPDTEAALVEMFKKSLQHNKCNLFFGDEDLNHQTVLSALKKAVPEVSGRALYIYIQRVSRSQQIGYPLWPILTPRDIDSFIHQLSIVFPASAIALLDAKNCANQTGRIYNSHLYVFCLAALRGKYVPADEWTRSLFESLNSSTSDTHLLSAKCIAFISAFAIGHPIERRSLPDTYWLGDDVQAFHELFMYHWEDPVYRVTCTHPFFARLFLKHSNNLDFTAPLDPSILLECWNQVFPHLRENLTLPQLAMVARRILIEHVGTEHFSKFTAAVLQADSITSASSSGYEEAVKKNASNSWNRIETFMLDCIQNIPSLSEGHILMVLAKASRSIAEKLKDSSKTVQKTYWEKAIQYATAAHKKLSEKNNHPESRSTLACIQGAYAGNPDAADEKKYQDMAHINFDQAYNTFIALNQIAEASVVANNACKYCRSEKQQEYWKKIAALHKSSQQPETAVVPASLWISIKSGDSLLFE